MQTILIVDDRQDNRAVLVAVLQHRGYRLLEAHSGAEALNIVRKEKPELVIADVLMPKMDGYELVQEIRADRSISGTAVIFYTASYIEEESRKLAEACGVRQVIVKPAEPEDVLKAVDAALGAPLSRKVAPPPPEFDRRHLHLVHDKLTEKVEELERLAHKHQLILNSAGEGIYEIDTSGLIHFMNSKACELLGWNAEEMIGKPAHATIHYKRADGSSYPVEECPIRVSMHDGATRRVTNDVFWRKDGKSFRVDCVCAPVRDETGRITGAIVTFKDITEQFMAEARLKLQEQQYRLLFEINPSPMWVYDTKTFAILAVNDAAVAQYGYSREEFLKLGIKDLRPAEDIPELLKARAGSSTRAASHYSGQFRHKRKDGSLLLVEIYSAPVTWETVSARIVSAIDITERKKAEDQLREQADIINRAHDAILIRDFNTELITFWNSGAEALYGWTANEAIGQRLGDLLFADAIVRAPLLEKLMATGEFHGEIKHRCKDGREVIVDSRTTLIRNDDGTPRAVLGINSDITERKKLETQLLRAQRLESIGTLASGVAHDLNNVLTPILICSEILRRKTTDESAHSTVDLIEESAKRGAAIVKQVLTFARGVEGERVLIKPSHLIEEMADIARKTFPKSIEIITKYPEELWSIEADPTQLHQVLLNLSVNARDAMPDGGTLTLAAENLQIDKNYAAMMPGVSVGGHVVLRVSDSGGGMPRSTIEKIFDPFFTTKELGKGTGLGLSTALGIVKSHHGTISVYSEPAQGTTFKVFLPAKEGSETEPAKAPIEKFTGHGELVLIVDDEPNILRVTPLILEEQNYRVACAAEAPEAIAILAQRLADVKIVVTDMMLPHMDGISLIRAMKKMKPDLKFIASTGQGQLARLTELQSLGVKHFLSKPYDSQKLLETVHQALQ